MSNVKMEEASLTDTPEELENTKVFAEKVRELAKEYGQDYLIINSEELDRENETTVGFGFGSSYEPDSHEISPFIDTIKSMIKLAISHPETLTNRYEVFLSMLSICSNNILGVLAVEHFNRVSQTDDKEGKQLAVRLAAGKEIYNMLEQSPSILGLLCQLDAMKKMDFKNINLKEIKDRVDLMNALFNSGKKPTTH